MQARLGRLAALIPLTVSMAVVGITVPAGAEDAAPAPCDPVPITDPKGDAEYYTTVNLVNPIGAASAAPPNHDIREAFFVYKDGADGKKTLTANLRVEKLDNSEIETEYAQASKFSLAFTSGGIDYVARAILKGGAWTYEFTTFELVPGAPAPVGLNVPASVATTGKQFPGAGGVISIDVPVADVAGLKDGAKFTDVAADSVADTDTEVGGFYADQAPDGTGVKTWTVVTCAADAAPTPEATPTAEATPTPEATPTAAPQQQEQQQQQSAPAQQQQQGGAAAPAASPSPTAAPRTTTTAAKPKPKPKAKKCKKGFKRKTVRGKSKCVKVKKKKKKKAARR